ncbi:MAG: hypothetical protein IIY77_07040 [Lachnospiraceae bacterium]|nr:hypothetical protein [Lachnospiraceae bacterium]
MKRAAGLRDQLLQPAFLSDKDSPGNRLACFSAALIRQQQPSLHDPTLPVRRPAGILLCYLVKLNKNLEFASNSLTIFSLIGIITFAIQSEAAAGIIRKLRRTFFIQYPAFCRKKE